MCAYRSECCIWCVVYKVTCKFCGDFYIWNTKNTLKIMEQHFQDVDQTFTNDKNLEYFAAHFAKHFTQKNKSTTMSQDYIFWNTFYGKPY